MRYEFKSTKNCVLGNEWDKNSEKEILKYAVGALLYTPASHASIAESICRQIDKNIKSITLCLEDSIRDEGLEYAEKNLHDILAKIYSAVFNGSLKLSNVPLIFIRVRNPEHMKNVFNKIKSFSEIITGFVLPKFDLGNVDSYKEAVSSVNCKLNSGKLYVMPIIESSSIINIETRTESLVNIKKSLADISDSVLNIRVGGNDFCNQFGFRRSIHNSIYDIKVISSVLSDIINVFGREYVVSAPVWEYFENAQSFEWLDGLKAEVAFDKLNGFIGKTAIHPSQISAIQEAMAVDYADFEDAKKILNWDSEILGVQKSIFDSRMNEVKVHNRWAEKIIALAEVYGVKRSQEVYKSIAL